MDWKKKEYWIVISLLLSTGIYANIIRHSTPKIQQPVNLDSIPLKMGDWVGVPLEMNERVAEILQYDESIYRTYVNSSGLAVGLFICYFKTQNHDAQIHSPRHCLPGGGWKILDHQRITVNVTNSVAAGPRINELLVSKNEEKQLVLYWFETRGGLINSEWGLKLDLVRNALLSRPTDVVFIRVTSGLESDSGSLNNYDPINNFVEKLFPYIRQPFYH